jgi:hypothetical protein
MTRDEARARLVVLNRAIATAVICIKSEREILDRYFVEARNIDTFGPIINPTLWNNPKRRQTDALLRPVYEAARNLIDAYDRQIRKIDSLRCGDE